MRKSRPNRPSLSISADKATILIAAPYHGLVSEAAEYVNVSQ